MLVYKIKLCDVWYGTKHRQSDHQVKFCKNENIVLFVLITLFKNTIFFSMRLKFLNCKIY